MTGAEVREVHPSKVASVRAPQTRPLSGDGVGCPVWLFVDPTGRVDGIEFVQPCRLEKVVRKKALKWRFEPWLFGGTPTAFAVPEEFRVDP